MRHHVLLHKETIGIIYAEQLSNLWHPFIILAQSCSKPIRHVVCAGALGQVKTDTRVMQLKLHEPTMAIGYSLRMCARHVDSTNAGRSNLVFRSKPIPETEMSNRLIVASPPFPT